MYYFKVPVFTKLSRIQNIIIMILQLIILTISISVSLYRGCSYEYTEFVEGCSKFKILPGNTMITNSSYSVWQYLKTKSYTTELITDIYDIKYYNVMNTTLNNYVLLKGNIILFDKTNQEYHANFKEYLNRIYYYQFIYDFKDKIDMDNEVYNLDISEGLLELMFLNNCSSNTVLLESNKGCGLKDNITNKINIFLSDYFNEFFIVNYSCYNCYINGIHTIYEFITVLSKCISIFVMFNSFLIMIYLFIISKIKNKDIGYIDNVIIYKDEIEFNDISELLKNEKKK